MVQMIATMVSMLLVAGAAGIVAWSVNEDWRALRAALAGGREGSLPLPPHTHRMPKPRRARFIQLVPAAQPLRAAA